MLGMSDTQPPAPGEPSGQSEEQPAGQPTEPIAATPPSMPPSPPPPTVAAPTAAPTAAPAAPALQRVRLRDQAFGIRSLVAVAVAGVIVGGLAGFGIHAATDDDHRDSRMGRFGPGFGPGGGFREGRGPGGFPGGGFPGGPGQGQGGPGTQQFPPPGGGTDQPTPSPTTAPSQSS
jgi:hypothetical protein